VNHTAVTCRLDTLPDPDRPCRLVRTWYALNDYELGSSLVIDGCVEHGILPEKRKVDSSILSLTTRSQQVILPFTCGNAIFGCTQSLPASARPGPFKTDYGRSLVHVECT
jgi:hypothetical protein